MTELSDLGLALRHAGLHPRALAAWCGTDRLSAVAARIGSASTTTPAGLLLAAFAGGAIVPRSALPPGVDPMLASTDGAMVRARHAILPVGPALLVCDHLDAPATEHVVCWPDDSSYHLASAIPPGRRERWVDLACGSAFAQLARPQLAAKRIAIELEPRAVTFARLGAALSNVAIEVRAGDIGAPPRPADEPADLVTCNAPIPDRGAVRWRSTDDDFFTRLFAAIPVQLAREGLAVVHAARDAIPDELPGDRAILTYTGEDAERAFCVLWWRPHASSRVVERHRALTVERPHVDVHDHDALARDRLPG